MSAIRRLTWLVAAGLSLPAAVASGAEGELRLVPDCRFCPAGREIEVAMLAQADDKPLPLDHLRLEVRDAHGGGVFSVEAPLCRGITILAGTSCSSNHAGRDAERQLRDLAIGEYWLTLRAGSLSSNAARIAIVPATAEIPPLVIEPLLLEGKEEDAGEILLNFANTRDERVDLAAAWKGSWLVADGVTYRQWMSRWAGPSELDPGRSWGAVLNFDDFVSEKNEPLKAGPHELQFVMAGRFSNLFHLTLSRDAGARPAALP